MHNILQSFEISPSPQSVLLFYGKEIEAQNVKIICLRSHGQQMEKLRSHFSWCFLSSFILLLLVSSHPLEAGPHPEVIKCYQGHWNYLGGGQGAMRIGFCSNPGLTCKTCSITELPPSIQISGFLTHYIQHLSSCHVNSILISVGQEQIHRKDLL